MIRDNYFLLPCCPIHGPGLRAAIQVGKMIDVPAIALTLFCADSCTPSKGFLVSKSLENSGGLAGDSIPAAIA